MSRKTITIASVLMTVVCGPAYAQGAFSQAPLPSMDATPAEPAPAVPAPPIAAAPAQSVGQSGNVDCSSIQKTLIERKNLVAKANAATTAKQKMTPAQACGLFTQLQSNGAAGMKWITANKEWCSIPDSFSEGFKQDHMKVGGIRSKICGMAAQASKMEAQARTSGGDQGGGLLGGPGLTGTYKLPQGAL